VLLLFNFFFQSQSNVSRRKYGKITRYGEMYGIRVRPSNVHPMEQAVWKSLSKMKKKKISKYGGIIVALAVQYCNLHTRLALNRTVWR
jgi:hypothetical protein